MRNRKNSSRGFTLIAALLILVLLSGAAAGLLFLVSNEVHMSGDDQENNLAYYGAQSGIEKMTSDLASLYAQDMVPQVGQIQNLATSNYWPSAAMVGNISYSEQISFPSVPPDQLPLNPTSTPPSGWNTINSGNNQGLYAETIPMLLQVTATRPGNASITLVRQVEVAEIPVFQFGVFCGYDCSYFAGPDFSFGGRVHTNMNLFLASGADLVFNDKVQAYKQVLTDELENGHATTSGYGGTIYIPKAGSGCPLNSFPPSGSNCIQLPGVGTIPGDASWSGGYPTIAGSANPSFKSISNGTFNDYLANSLTGVSNLQLPFVQNSCTSNPPPCTDPIAIIRKPLVGEVATSQLGSERLYNKAQIRILLADDPNDLHPERGAAPLADGGDIQLPSNTSWATTPFTNSGTTPALTLTGGTAVNTNGATEAVGFATAGTYGWTTPLTDSGSTGWATWPLFEAYSVGGVVPTSTTGSWIRVEWCSSPTTCTPVTKEWLNLGIGQPFNTPPSCPGPSIAACAGGGSTNSVNPNAIIILQQLNPLTTVSSANIASTSSWYPINFYDTREGEMRDTTQSDYSYTITNTHTVGYPDTYNVSTCSVNGIMSAVELDVGNLARWLNGSMGNGTTGANVPYSSENGYVLYFSDHRGMRIDPNPSNGGQTPRNVYSGESGLEDVVNSSSNLTSTVQDGALEPATYYTYSPEDVDQNTYLDNWGEQNLGYAYGINTDTNPLNSYVRIPNTTALSSTSNNCALYDTSRSKWGVYNNSTSSFTMPGNVNQGMANPVSGARHVLKLVDGGMSTAGVSYLPVQPAASGCAQTAANPTACGGFTVASENPVYIQGNYNSSSADAFWGTANNATPTQTPHSAASIIADSVSVLSNQWSDANSLLNPTVPGNRGTSASAYYRVAISGGKNIPFPSPGWANSAGINDFGTDGGMHNFLRYLETWNNTLYYNGSLVSMYYAEYDTGTFKCCTTVYSPPTRDYYFDTLFLNPSNLPPATPEFQDVVNESYHQSFTPGNSTSIP